jgi:Protein of unknown function (DUF2752)
MRWSWRTVTTVTVLLVASLVVLYAVDPTRHMVTPPCPYLTLTGIACPGCGLTRCLHFLLHGDVAQAFAFNPWAFVIAPAAVAFALLPALADEMRTLRVRTGISWVMLVVTLAFWVWRNTAAYPFMRV